MVVDVDPCPAGVIAAPRAPRHRFPLARALDSPVAATVVANAPPAMSRLRRLMARVDSDIRVPHP